MIDSVHGICKNPTIKLQAKISGKNIYFRLLLSWLRPLWRHLNKNSRAKSFTQIHHQTQRVSRIAVQRERHQHAGHVEMQGSRDDERKVKMSADHRNSITCNNLRNLRCTAKERTERKVCLFFDLKPTRHGVVENSYDVLNNLSANQVPYCLLRVHLGNYFTSTWRKRDCTGVHV
eukprot:Pompholyxophrys_punicea_v1_NODE_420_length_2008_cov_4.910906.p2 type:complete len:175 gc:universal NODE_420_length_2008_cov_4.910906:428-952(+)